MRRRTPVLCRFAAASVLTAVVACGGGSTTPAAPAATPVPPSRAAITISFTPDPVVAIPSTADPAFPFRAVYTMTIRETAGLGANVNFWNETLINPTTMLQAPTRNFGADRVIQLAGTNRLSPQGSLTIQRDFTYNPGGNVGTGRAVNIQVVVQVTDDRGNTINTDAVIRIL